MSDASEIQQLFRTPAAAAAAVPRARDDPALLHALAVTIADPAAWAALCPAGAVALFLDLIMQPAPERSPADSDTTMPPWALPLQGLFNSMVGIQRTPGAFTVPENREAAVQMFVQAPAICRRLYGEKASLSGTAPYAEDLRRFVALWTQATWTGVGMLGLTGVQGELKSSYAIELATCCWVFATSVELHARGAISLRQEILTQPQPTRTELDQVIAAAGSLEKLISASNLALENPDVVDDALASSMSLLTALTGQTSHVELSRQYAKMKTHHSVMTAVRRQLDRSSIDWTVLEYSGMLIVNIVNEAESPTDDITSLIEQKSLIPLLGGILLRCVQASKQSPSWMSLVTLLKHTCTCRSSTCRVRTSPEYIAALRTHLAWRWWPTLKRLHSSPGSTRAQIENDWATLGRMVGLMDATERQKHETPANDVGGCWWVECVRDVGAPGTELRRCSGCKWATYCTTECQNMDWKGHKKLCTGRKSSAT